MKKYALLEVPQIEGKYVQFGDGWSDHKIKLPNGKQFYKVSTIMRAKPPHRNHIAMLEALCQKSQYLKINIGSSNKLDEKNPFSPEETEDMMRLGLKEYSNYEIVPLPDYNDDDKWATHLFRINPDFTEFVCNNDWVLGILKKRMYDEDGHKKYDIIFPDQVLPKDEMIYQNGIYISATVVRKAIVDDGPWEKYLLPAIAGYIKENSLVDRVKKLCGD
jgi:nicotinamide mononucleotide adenylyltransferase